MGNCVIILGKSGTGKSTSIKGLDPKESVVINILKKKLPFKGSATLYNSENKNLFNLDSHLEIIKYLEIIDKKAPHVKNVIIDDAVFVMRKEFFSRAKETGYTKFTDIASHFQQIIATCENLREDLNIFFLLHSEPISSEDTIIGFKVAIVGKLLDVQYNPIEVVPVVLYASIKYDDKGAASYGFYTHAVKEGNIEIPAKSPDGMFEEDYIPNDLGYVVSKMGGYYKSLN